MAAYSLTSAPRSSVIHAIGDPAQFTLCGRRIGEKWAGEYDEAPAGPMTCSRCLAAASATADTVAYPVGARVGLLTGFQSVGGAWVGSYGVVTGHREFWRGTVSYLVRADGETESFVYDSWQLSGDLSRDVTPVREAAEAAGIPVGADGWPVVGHPVWAWNATHSGDLVRSIGEWIATPEGEIRRRIDAGTCVDCDDSGRWDDGAFCTCPAGAREKSARQAAILRHPSNLYRAFTRRGYRPRRAEPIGPGSRLLVMAWNEDRREYVIGSIRPGDSEWCNGSYTPDMVRADEIFRRRMALSRNTYGA